MADRYVCIKPSGSYTLDASESARYAAEYTSLSGAEAGENGTVDTDNLYIDIIHGDATYNWDGTDDTTQATFDGWNCTNGGKVIVRTLTSAQAANGISSRPDFSDGSKDATEYRLYKSGNQAILLDNDYNSSNFLDIEVIGLQIEAHTTNTECVYIQTSAKHSGVKFEKCWITQNTGDSTVLNFESDNGHPTFVNCVFDGSGTGNVIQDTTSYSKIINCTVVKNNAGVGINNANVATNNLVARATDDFAFITSGNLNASDDGDGPGTNITPSGSSWTNELEDGSTFTDLRPLNSGNIYLAGETQNNQALVPSDDIAGNARPTGANRPTIGAFEYVSAGATSWTGTIGGVTDPASVGGVSVENIDNIGGI